MEFIYTILILAFYQAANTAYMQSSSFPYLCRTTFKQLFLRFGVQVISDTFDISNFHLGGLLSFSYYCFPSKYARFPTDTECTQHLKFLLNKLFIYFWDRIVILYRGNVVIFIIFSGFSKMFKLCHEKIGV